MAVNKRADDPDPPHDLTAELRADAYAARVRDYGEADAATYEQRVRDGADTARHLDQPVNGEPANYRKLLADAASRGSSHEQGKEGPER